MKRMGVFLIVLMIAVGLSCSAYATLVDMKDGTIYDTATQLSWLKNANTVGTAMTWSAAGTWAANLNAIGFAGLTGWRLPDPGPGISFPGCSSCPCPGSEIATLVEGSAELDNACGASASNFNSGPFVNLYSTNLYWLGTDPSSSCQSNGSNDEFYFETGPGSEGCNNPSGLFYAWAVRSGARIVPSPVGYKPQWLIITLVSLTVVGVFLLWGRMARA